MKLYYYNLEENFGDSLNPWLWSQLLPDIFDEDASTIFVGIGTILNNLIPHKPTKVVFGAGVGYGNRKPVIDNRWKIYCVRGPLSAQALALSPNLALTDPAVLIKNLWQPKERKNHPVSFMPHVGSIKYWDWKSFCESLDIHYIDPQADIERVLHDIDCSELLIAEAMHGAIVADALRIPWIPVRINKFILEFKWYDWCQSVGLDYAPVFLPRLYSEEGIASRLHTQFKLLRFYDTYVSNLLTQMLETGLRYAVQKIVSRRVDQISISFEKLIRNTPPVLSSDQALSSVISRLEEKLENFKADCASGHFVG